ncbi:RagB/SusD family nutrient uptake outer membrane protein [Sphingobacterium multivorum]|uniref:RagB/SusD family nutrient uptake outer membrane protein n=1 Tax=Sphingobacterium multivorum TaxID=28454 RepID=UPI00267ACA8B|nr:RagB/SusD family nutrient uptake outer membrane protein [Sphingobacterium multivorum]
MKIYYKLSYFLGILLGLMSLVGCSKYLDISDDFSASDSKGFIFNNPGQSVRFQRYIYKGMPNYSDYAGTTASADGLGNPWVSMSDETKNNSSGYLRDVVLQGFNASGSTFHRWTSLYKVIRQATVYLDSARTIGVNGDPDFIDAAQLKSLKAECYFFRAYAHYLLFEQYGPVPVMTTESDPADPGVDFARNSVDEVVEAIDNDIVSAIEGLDENRFSASFASGFDENKLAIPTKGVALALRAKLWIYAASPLFNGGYSEALSLSNPDGKQLFPQYDAKKWVKAKQVLKDFIDFANNGNYTLYYSSVPNNAYMNVYELFQRYNKEIIWANSTNSWATAEMAQTPRDIYRTAGGSTAGYMGVTQEAVDAFFMANGLKINDPNSGYTESGFTDVVNPATRFVKNNAEIVLTDPNVSTMYANREPRFYASVTYQGKSWHDVVSNASLQGTTAASSLATRVFFSRDILSSVNPRPGYGGVAHSGNATAGGYSKTGYMLYKFNNRTIHPTVANGIRSVFRPSIIFRLADFYLLYAEACNEVDPSDPEIIKYIDLVRKRAGIPGYAELNASGKKTDVIGNQSKQREAIQRERRIELFAEGQRYFDVRRWMIAETAEGRQGGVFTGMNIAGNQSDLSYFKRVDFDNGSRIFKKAMYLYPIPYSEISKSKLLIQNPGY